MTGEYLVHLPPHGARKGRNAHQRRWHPLEAVLERFTVCVGSSRMGRMPDDQTRAAALARRWPGPFLTG